MARFAAIRSPAMSGQSVTRSSRDPEVLRVALEGWIGDQLGRAVTIPRIDGTSTNGMSSETELVDVHSDGFDVEHLVVRIAPDPHDVPVFPVYDMERQFEVIRQVGVHSSVPVPRVRWCESTGSVIGTPFFVMDRVDGVVPPDVMPYNFGSSWLSDASPADQERLVSSTIRAIAGLHEIPDAAQAFDFLALSDPGDTALRRHLAHTTAWYEFAALDLQPSPLVERGLDWLAAHCPATTEEVLCWGDSRIGNTLYRDFEPVAVLDWEMAALGPRPLDITWLAYAHRVFEDLAHLFEFEGMPHFLRIEDVTAEYAAITGHQLGDLDWYLVYDAVQFGIVFLRTGARQIHFGEIERPDDIDDLLRNRPSLERLLADQGA